MPRESAGWWRNYNTKRTVYRELYNIYHIYFQSSSQIYKKHKKHQPRNTKCHIVYFFPGAIIVKASLEVLPLVI